MLSFQQLEDCWTYRRAEVTRTFFWTFFTLILQTLLRIVPSFGISILNIHMYKKLKSILRERRNVREKRRHPKPTPLNISYGTLVHPQSCYNNIERAFPIFSQAILFLLVANAI